MNGDLKHATAENEITDVKAKLFNYDTEIGIALTVGGRRLVFLISKEKSEALIDCLGKAIKKLRMDLA